MTLYSFNGRYPDILPNRIRLSNGLTKTDKTTFTDSDLLDAKYFPVADKPLPPDSADFAVVEWDGGNLRWNTRTTPTDAETEAQWTKVRAARNEKLLEADIMTMMAFERGTEDPHVDPYKNALRNITDSPNNAWSIVWPIYGEDVDSA